MARGLAYRWDNPSIGKLNLYPNEWHGDDPLFQAPSEMTGQFKSAGTLSRIPLEIIQKICLLLDLDTLKNFCLASSALEAKALSVLEYSRLLEHAPDTLELMDITEVAKYYTPLLPRLPLQEPKVMSRSHTKTVVANYMLDDDVSSQLRVINSIPGWYGTMRASGLWIRRDSLVSTYDAEQLALQEYGTLQNVEAAFREHTAQVSAEKLAQDMWLTGNFATLPRAPQMVYSRFLTCDSFPIKRRFLATTAFPYYDPETHRIESGLYCRDCTIVFEQIMKNPEVPTVTDEMIQALDRQYHTAFLEEEMPHHFALCSAIKSPTQQLNGPALRKWPFERSGEQVIVEWEEIDGEGAETR
ncbi:predicted protein [Uncinocarpus reesii 1704]|uniref:F-box domain-containing protein n=1 Tax=Uncinocarpus reesii (strain UAMH 1704) TaxID=336963 RepID=C4JL37_UNCRE|nr:uncharacterized protein UREG_00252 [Uncinocarpus reesii 1704]EEP75406.1 predicted protein [Uncinocarpus reesii 1704]